MSSICVSHDRRDKAFSRRLAVDLQRLGIKVWLDEIEQRLGDPLITGVQGRVITTEHLGVVLSPSSVASPWARREVESTLLQEIARGRVRFLPLLRADCDVPAFLAGKISFDFRTDAAYPASFAELMEQLGAPESPASPLGLDGAEFAIQEFAATRGLLIGAVSEATPSPLGTAAFKARLVDFKGVIYCHASGPLQGEAFYVRKEIGGYYEDVLGGSGSALGLPTSHEEMQDLAGNQLSYFEAGYIEWLSKTSMARAVGTTSGTETLIGERKL